MKKEEIIKYINKAIKTEQEECYVFVEFMPDKQMNGAAAAIQLYRKTGGDWSKVFSMIYLDKGYFSIKNRPNIKYYHRATLLHELGHYFTRSCSKSKRELLAQIWAYNKARKMKDKKTTKIIKKILINWGTSGDWQSSDRRYMIAYKIAKKMKII